MASYNITRTDGTSLVGVSEGEKNSAAAPIVITGPNTPTWGQNNWENQVRILENFARDTEPVAPLIGQHWYKKDTNVVLVRTSANQWKVPSATTVTAGGTAPTSSVQPGDLWHNNTGATRIALDATTWRTIRTTDSPVLSIRGNTTEGGQFRLGYAANTGNAYGEPTGTSTWNIDVANANGNDAFRIFRQNASSSVLSVLTVREDTGNVHVPNQLSLGSVAVADGEIALQIAGNNTGLGQKNTLRFVDTDASTQLNQQIGRIEFYSSDATITDPAAKVRSFIGGFAADSSADSYLAFATSATTTEAATERMRITNTGNVSIGTTSSVTGLLVNRATGNGVIEVRTDDAAADSTVRIRVPTGSTGNSVLYFGDMSNDNLGRIVYNHPNDSLSVGTNGGSNHIFIQSDGNVGIGTNSPSAKLHVNGIIRATTPTPSTLNDTQVATTAFVQAAALGAAATAVSPGAVMAFLMASAPAGWLVLNGGTIGNAVSGSTLFANALAEPLYIVLWTVCDNTILPIQNSSGVLTTRGASASADFAANKRLPVPDVRGYFVRAYGTNGDGTGSGSLGAKQADELKSHTHNYTQYGGSFGDNSDVISGGGSLFTYNGPTSATGGTETRPKNIAMLYCIKY